MSNSSLVDYTRLSPNNSGMRIYPLTRITIHNTAGQGTVETFGEIFAAPSRKASCNYAVDMNGKVALIVDEANRSWCSSSSDNDNRAITIETSSDMYSPYYVRDVTYNKLILLVADICRRNGKTKITWLGDKAKSLAYSPASNEMLMTVHRWFGDTDCPGEYLLSRMSDIAYEVNNLLGNDGGGTVTPDPPIEDTTTYTTLVRFHPNDGTSNYGTTTFTSGKGEHFFDRNWPRTGYTITGWDADPNCAWDYPQFGVTAAIPDAWIKENSPSTDLWAIWKPKELTVVFDDGIGTRILQTFYYGIGGTFFNTGFRKQGCKLVGWNTKKDMSGKNYSLDEEVGNSIILNSASQIVLYAVWEADGTITIKHDGVYKRGVLYVKYNGSYKPVFIYRKTNGTYKLVSS